MRSKNLALYIRASEQDKTNISELRNILEKKFGTEVTESFVIRYAISTTLRNEQKEIEHAK